MVFEFVATAMVGFAYGEKLPIHRAFGNRNGGWGEGHIVMTGDVVREGELWWTLANTTSTPGRARWCLGIVLKFEEGYKLVHQRVKILWVESTSTMVNTRMVPDDLLEYSRSVSPPASTLPTGGGVVDMATADPWVGYSGVWDPDAFGSKQRPIPDPAPFEEEDDPVSSSWATADAGESAVAMAGVVDAASANTSDDTSSRGSPSPGKGRVKSKGKSKGKSKSKSKAKSKSKEKEKTRAAGGGAKTRATSTKSKVRVPGSKKPKAPRA